jgi:hypothetical protein
MSVSMNVGAQSTPRPRWASTFMSALSSHRATTRGVMPRSASHASIELPSGEPSGQAISGAPSRQSPKRRPSYCCSPGAA